MRFAILLLVMAIGGPFLAWQGYSHRQFRAKLATEGVTVDALASGAEVKSGRRGSKSATLSISYQGEGRSISKQMPVSNSFIDSITGGDALSVETVKLTYLKLDPEQAIIVGGTPDISVNLWIGLVVTAIGVIGGGLYVRSRASRGPGDE